MLKVHLKKIVHFLKLERQLELLKEFHNDNRGGLLISVTAKITDKEYERYRHLMKTFKCWVLNLKILNLFHPKTNYGFWSHMKSYLMMKQLMKYVKKANDYFKLSYDEANCHKEGYKLIDSHNRFYGDMLLTYINNNFKNIKLTRRIFDE